MSGTIPWTVERLLALPEDGQRHELVHGEHLVTPAPNLGHQWVLRALFLQLDAFVERNRLGTVLWSPADLTLAPGTLVQPDLFVIRPEEAEARNWKAVRNLLLAVEALSPSTARQDRFIKRRLYQEVGVPHYWVVDPVARAIEVWMPEAKRARIVADELRWRPEGAGEELAIRVPDLFA
ncbi:MAG: Uma2 family endonuclease [Gemmatimonadales bacterium]